MPIKPTYASFGALIGIIAGLLLILIMLPAKMTIESFLELKVPPSMSQLLTFSSDGDVKVTKISDFLSQGTISGFSGSPIEQDTVYDELVCQWSIEGEATVTYDCLKRTGLGG